MPKVSIVIPVYNGSDYLRTAVDSALAQTYPDIEIVVVNDGSNDGGATEAVALSYGERIRYLRKPNGHVASALNFGIRHMSGDYFSWLSHDDMYHSHKVESQMRATENAGARAVIYGDFEALDVASGERRAVRQAGVAPEHFRWYITMDNSIHGCTLLLPRVCFEECGTFDESLRTTQDYDMWFRIAARFRFVHVPGVIVTARQHPGQGSLQLRGIALEECNKLLSRFVRTLTDDELRGAMALPAAQCYAAMAANLQERGFLEARDAALSLAKSRLADETIGAAVTTLLEIASVQLAGMFPILSRQHSADRLLRR